MLINTPKTVQIPHEPECSMEFYPLSGKQLRLAEAKGMRNQMALMADAPPIVAEVAADKRKASADAGLVETREEVKAGEPEAVTYSNLEYDIDMTLDLAQVKFTGPGYEGFERAKHLDQLDATTLDWAYQTTLRETITPS